MLRTRFYCRRTTKETANLGGFSNTTKSGGKFKISLVLKSDELLKLCNLKNVLFILSDYIESNIIILEAM